MADSHVRISDNDLIRAMFMSDPELAACAKRIFDKRHASDPQPREPRHCDECFEGCPKCQ